MFLRASLSMFPPCLVFLFPFCGLFCVFFFFATFGRGFFIHFVAARLKEWPPKKVATCTTSLIHKISSFNNQHTQRFWFVVFFVVVFAFFPFACVFMNSVR
eukprot:c6566_g1_i1.p1 GENE.c6566_g1_i1~~c6566_g1_i1.p1  ORF type:complete len:101 (+),score=10.47 c6566_g1_i1:103-405(+)